MRAKGAVNGLTLAKRSDVHQSTVWSEPGQKARADGQETLPHGAPMMRFPMLEERLERFEERLVLEQTRRIQQLDLQVRSDEQG